MLCVDNIVIGTPLVSLKKLGVTDEEVTLILDRSETFLPTILKTAGVFESTNQIRKLNEQRLKSTKITDPLSKNLWRNIDAPEMTHFKIGKKIFWLIVGE